MPVSNDRKTLLVEAANRSIRYLDGLADRAVAASPDAIGKLRAALDEALPDKPMPDRDALAFIDEFGSPATVASAGGRYFGFVTGSALPATLASNWLAGAWDQNSFGFASSPAIALFEEAALRWAREALGLPGAAAGAVVTGATMANLTGLAAARHRVLANVGWDIESDGLFGAPEITVIVGEEAHASLIKVLALLGLGRERVVRVAADRQGRMQAGDLPPISGPTIICLQAGNVNSGAFDPAHTIIPRAHDAGAWVHVDGAFGLWAHACPDYAALCDGFADADSWATDAHKWLNVPYDSGLAFVRDEDALHRAMTITGAYLQPSGYRDAIDFTPESSRRARGLDVWTALRTLGREGLSDLVGRNCRQASYLADGLRDAGADVLNEVVLNQVVVSFGSDERTRAVITAIQEQGECWCGGTVWQGRAAMRVSVSSWVTSQDDIERSLAAMLKVNASIA